MTAATTTSQQQVKLVGVVCAAQVLVQIGAFFFPALLAGIQKEWGISYGEAGTIIAAFYGAYMLSVPILVTLTDRIDPKRVYLFGVATTVAGHLLFGWLADGFWSGLLLRGLTGIGWAGTYMTGLKLLSDQVDAKMMSRAVSGHAAGIGVSGALSFICADALASLGGWRFAFIVGGLSALVAWLTVWLVVPARTTPLPQPAPGARLFDFRPVFRNRSAMAYAVAYCVHTLEMNVLRGWGVAFLASVAALHGVTSHAVSPAVIVTVLGLVGTAASVAGNEAAIRYGRRRLIAIAFYASMVLAVALGVLGPSSYILAVALIIAYGVVIWLDSSSLTAGAAGTAEPSRRGATLAVHSMLGYGGGFVGPIIVGLILDGSGGPTPLGWALAFSAIALLQLAGLIGFYALEPRDLIGDRKAERP